MVGGSANVEDERIYKVEIPERAGALDTFLAAVSPAFQITMTHYRSDGGQVGNTLFGVKVSRGDRAKLEEAIASTGYAFEDMTSNAAYNMLYGCQRVGACAISFDEDEA
jgi:threonine dehydratase